MHHVVAARQRGWSSNVHTSYSDVNRFALRCVHGQRSTAGRSSTCTYIIVVERQSINGSMVWIAVREKGHTNHTPSTVGKLGDFKTDAQNPSARKRRSKAELDDKEYSGSESLDDEAAQPYSNVKRSLDKPASPPTRSHKRKRPRLRSVSPPPKPRNAVASTSGSNRKSIDPYSTISQTLPRPIPRVSPTHWGRVQHQPAHPALPIPPQSHSRYQSHPTPPIVIPSLPIAKEFAEDLNLFLRSILEEHVTYAPLLIELGITSHSSIASLLMMDKPTLDRLGVYLDRGTANHKGIGILARAYFIQQVIKVGKQAKAEFQATG
jgi:hypothetical protein